jgi:hypothetical protein
MATRARRLRGEALEEIKNLHRLGWTPKQIHTTIKETLKEKLPANDIPPLRQVQRVVNDLTPHDLTGAWSMAVADPDDVRDVLDVLAAVVMESDGRISHVTEREASWITRVRRAVPALDARSVFKFAQDYMLREDARLDTDDLDFTLAIAPSLSDKELAKRHAALHARLWPDRTFSPLANHAAAAGAWVKERTGSASAGRGMEEIIELKERGESPLKPAKKAKAAKRQPKKGATK